MNPAVLRLAGVLVVIGAAVAAFTFIPRSDVATPAMAAAENAAKDGVRMVEWTDLMPEDEQSFMLSEEDDMTPFPENDEQFFNETGANPLAGSLDGGADDDFGSGGFGSNQPQGTPRPDLAGQKISLAGYMTPLMVEDNKTRTFLLVPYVGACVHVPAPPPNQIVLVQTPEPIDVRDMWDPFRAVGTLSVETTNTALAEVGYTMKLDRIEPYIEPED